MLHEFIAETNGQLASMAFSHVIYLRTGGNGTIIITPLLTLLEGPAAPEALYKQTWPADEVRST